MAADNVPITPTIIAKEALAMIDNSMVMGALVHRQYKQEWNAKVGESITIRKPNKFSVTASSTRSNTNIAEKSDTLTVDTQAHVSWAFLSAELTQTIEDYSERYIKPAANALANSVDVALCALYKDVYNETGTFGSVPSNFSDLGDAQTRLDEEAAESPRIAVLSPATNWAMADGLKGTFAAKPANDIHTKGYLGTVAGLDTHMDQNIQTHTTGVHTTSATPLMSATAVDGASTLATDGWNSSSSTLTDGDVITVAAVYAVNPVSKATTGVLRQIVVTTLTTSSGGAMATLPISPTLYDDTTDYQNVDAMPQSGAAITCAGTESTAYKKNLIFHKNAFALVTLPLAMPANVWGSRTTYNGLSVRVVKAYDIAEDEEIIRMDILYGTKTLYPEFACRMTQ